MKIVFVSNYFNHHQKPFCEELYQRLGGDFTFVSTSVMGEERKKLGYIQEKQPPYVFLAYESDNQKKKAITLINNADIVMAGSAHNSFLDERIRQNKFLLRYSERPFKRKVSLLKKIYHSINFRRMNLFKNNIYMLAASAYAASDFNSMGLYKGKIYKWGYFPDVKEYDLQTLMASKKRNTLIWCGRFIDWKHPDDVIILAQRLKKEGYDFSVNIIGAGVMENELHNLAKHYDLSDKINFLGSMSPQMVRSFMEESAIYLFTSDRQEGWGAVLNESMNSGCAVVASQEIGSVPFLINNQENGLVYESGNLDDLFNKVRYLLDNPNEQIRMGKAAYKTITKQWNAQIAAERFLIFTEKIKKQGFCDIYTDGPCSMA